MKEPLSFEVLEYGHSCVKCLRHIVDMTDRHLDLTEGYCWDCYAMQPTAKPPLQDMTKLVEDAIRQEGKDDSF